MSVVTSTTCSIVSQLKGHARELMTTVNMFITH